MPRFFLFCSLFFYSQSGWAQIQALELQLINTNQDTQRVNLLNKLADLYYLSQPLISELYTQQALRLSDTLHYEIGKADAYFNQSFIHKLREQGPQQLQALLHSLRIVQSIGDSLRMAKIYTEMGIAAQQMGDRRAALNYFDKAMGMHIRSGHKRQQALVLRRLGVMESSNPSQAEAYYRRALALIDEINDKESMASLYNNLGVMYADQKKYTEALPYYERALKLHLELNNLNRLPAAYYNLGQLYLNQNKIKDALFYAQKGLPIAIRTDNRMAIYESTKLHADIYFAKMDYERAYQYLAQHAQIKDSLVNTQNVTMYADIKQFLQQEQGEKEIALLKDQERLQLRQKKIALVTLTVFSLVAGFGFFQQRKIIRQKGQLLEKNNELHTTELSLTQTHTENQLLKQQQLEHDLEHRHKELLIYTLNLTQKNALMENLRESIRELLSETTPDSKIKLNRLIKLIDYTLETEKDWDEFKMYFEKVNNSFFERLKTKFSDLSQSDLKLCALISLNLSMKETAELLGISPESVKMARHRLRKKLELNSEENLTDFISSFK